MKIIRNIVIFTGFVLMIAGCSTTGSFIVPEDTNLYINERPEPVTIKADGTVTTSPYFWTSIAGVPYRLEKNGKTVKEGKLQATFRPVAIFWPPAALIYWPAGLNPNITYDLVNDTQE